MSKEFPPPSSPTKPAPAFYQWPWGQVALLLIVLTLCLHAAHELAERFGADFGETFQGLFAIPGFVGLGCALFAWWSGDKLRQRGEVRPSNPPLRKINFGMGGVWFSLVLLQTLIPAVRAASAASGRANTSAPSGELRLISSPNGAITMKVPTEWTDFPSELLAPPAFGAIDPTQQMGVATFVEDRRNLEAKTVEQYAALVSSRFSKEFDKVELLEATTSSRSEAPQLQEYIDVTKDGERLRYLLAFIVRPSLFIQLRAWAPPSVFEPNEAELAEILRSVQYRGDEAQVRDSRPISNP